MLLTKLPRHCFPGHQRDRFISFGWHEETACTFGSEFWSETLLFRHRYLLGGLSLSQWREDLLLMESVAQAAKGAGRYQRCGHLGAPSSSGQGRPVQSAGGTISLARWLRRVRPRLCRGGQERDSCLEWHARIAYRWLSRYRGRPRRREQTT